MNNGDSVKFYGIYRGIVMKNKDPEGHRRIQVKIPQLGGGETLTQDWAWAWPLFVAGQRPYTPEVGEGVWIQFESGDPAYPIWIGSFGKNLKPNRHISIKPVANTVDLAPLSGFVTVARQNDGTNEIDLMATILAMANKIKVLETNLAQVKTTLATRTTQNHTHTSNG